LEANRQKKNKNHFTPILGQAARASEEILQKAQKNSYVD
jgi:hypothetical protein